MDKKELNRLADEITERVTKQVTEHLTGIFDAKFKDLNNKYDTLLRTWDTHADEWSEDRKSLAEIVTDHKAILQWFKEVAEMLPKQTKVITNKLLHELDKKEDTIVQTAGVVVEQKMEEFALNNPKKVKQIEKSEKPNRKWYYLWLKR